MLFETSQLKTGFSNISFFLPSITDRSKQMNQHLGLVNLTPIDIIESSFETENDISFDPLKLDISCDEKKGNDKCSCKDP